MLKHLLIKRMLQRTFLLLSGCFFCSLTFAEISVNSLFSDHMVLQQGVTVPVWGSSTTEGQVTVRFNGQQLTSKVSNGKWMVKLKPMAVSKEPLTMEVFAEDTIRIH